MDESAMAAVLAALRARGRMTLDAVAAATGLEPEIAERALQALLLRRAVVVAAPRFPARGSRIVSFAGGSRVATWSANETEVRP